MRSLLNLRLAVPVAVAVTALILSSCGQSPIPFINNPQAGGPYSAYGAACAPGQINLGYRCFATMDLTLACAAMGGQAISINGVLTCRYTLYFNYPNGSGLLDTPEFGSFTWQSAGSAFTRLSSDSLTLLSAYDARVYVRKGDKLLWSASGSWGGSYPSCSSTDANGVSGGHTVMYGSYNEGIVGYDGTEVFNLGTSTTRTMNNDGDLRIGFNTPVYSYPCGQFSISKLQLQRCQDATGNVYQCP